MPSSWSRRTGPQSGSACEYVGLRFQFAGPVREVVRHAHAAINYANILNELKRFEEAKSLLRKSIPVARRVFGESDEITLRMRQNYAEALYKDPAATLDDLREAVTTLEEIERTARRVLGGAHPLTPAFESHLKWSRAALAARETLSGKS